MTPEINARVGFKEQAKKRSGGNVVQEIRFANVLDHATRRWQLASVDRE